jgi:hypothetical protein
VNANARAANLFGCEQAYLEEEAGHDFSSGAHRKCRTKNNSASSRETASIATQDQQVMRHGDAGWASLPS